MANIIGETCLPNRLECYGNLVLVVNTHEVENRLSRERWGSTSTGERRYKRHLWTQRRWGMYLGHATLLGCYHNKTFSYMTFYKKVILCLLNITSWFYNTSRIEVRETDVEFTQHDGREYGADLSTSTDRERERERERESMRSGAGMWGNILKD